MNNPMHQALLKLQTHDLRCRDLEKRLTLIPQELDKILAKRDALNAESKQAKDNLQSMELDIKNNESEIARLESESGKMRQQTAMVRKNNEYEALLNAIEENKKRISAIEEKLIGLLDEVEILRAGTLKICKRNKAESQNLRQEFEELLDFSKSLKSEIARMHEERPALRANVVCPELEQYEALLKARNATIPIVEVEKGCCGNCHTSVPPQTLNIISKGEMVSCDNCQHLLYDRLAN